MEGIKITLATQNRSVEGLNDMWDKYYNFINSKTKVGEVEMDITGLPCLDSMSLNLFVCVYRLTKKSGGNLKITGTCDRCFTILESSNILSLDGLEVEREVK